MSVIELLHEPGQPARASLGHDHAQTRVAFENAPGEEINKRFEEIVEEALGVLEHAGGLAGGATARHRQEDSDVPGQYNAALFQRVPQRFPARIIELRLALCDHQIDLPDATLGD